MSAWWTKTPEGVQKHDGRKPKLGAMIRLQFASTMGKHPLDSLGLYRRDPEQHPNEPNVLPAMIAKEESRRLGAELRDMMRRPKKGGSR